MDEQTLRTLLFSLKVSVQRANYTGSKKRTRWLNISCPFAPFTHARGSDTNPSFGITITEDGPSHYKCLACGLKGRASALPTRLGGYRNEDNSKLRHWAEMAELQASIAKPIIDWEVQGHDEHGHTAEQNIPAPELVNGYPRALGIPYLRERGIHWPTPLKLDLRFDAFQNRVLFPCYDRACQFRGFTGRSTLQAERLSKNNPKVRDYFGLDKRALFLGLRFGGVGRNIIVEGLIDYARMVQAGYTNTRAILGTSLTPEKLDILIDAGEPVYFFMDNDVAGWTALFGNPDEDGNLETENAWAFQLYTEIAVWIVPYPRSFDGTDPGSIPEERLKKHLDRAWLFTGKAPYDAAGNRTFTIS